MPLLLAQHRHGCPWLSTDLVHDPLSGVVSDRLSCGFLLAPPDCFGCPVCSCCGQVRCSCSFLSIDISVKIKGTIIETVPLRAALAG